MKHSLALFLGLTTFFISQLSFAASMSAADANEILSNTDLAIENNLTPEDTSANQLSAINPALGNLWNNTAMIFGASADGIGVGTTFAISDAVKGEALFATNFHVVEPFCEADEKDQYTCQSLFVLHDVAINTETKETVIDGSHPWKSEVTSLVFVDKLHDLVVFKVALPADFVMNTTKTVTDYDAKKPEFAAVPNSPLKTPINTFDVYMVSYSLDAGMIKKSWKQGRVDSVRYFENDQKQGLFIAIKHTIQTGPGSSGSPLAFVDGRIIGMNTSAEVNQFYAKSWIFWQKLETHLSYYAIPTIFLKGVSP